MLQVETVADTYMVSCGVPMENPYHASELALMALSLRNSVENYRVRFFVKSQYRSEMAVKTNNSLRVVSVFAGFNLRPLEDI